VIIRKSSRVILLNERDEVCLFLHLERDRRYWVMPGGGVEPDESWEAAAIRELGEETGLADIELGPCVWMREKVVMLFGELTRGVERYFLARVADAEVSNANQLDYERAVYTDVRWWPVDAIRASDETFYPEGLADLLAPIVAGDLPNAPVALTR
jgi:8-oxo-dGTP pyrophosphatase MutT (NUDIX family)